MHPAGQWWERFCLSIGRKTENFSVLRSMLGRDRAAWVQWSSIFTAPQPIRTQPLATAHPPRHEDQEEPHAP
jgi:hypothetical protein